MKINKIVCTMLIVFLITSSFSLVFGVSELAFDGGGTASQGSGAGRDTIELLKNNWNVLSIDKEDTEYIIREQLNQKESENFKFKKCFFGEMNLPKVNLIVANFSLPFSKKEFFGDIWKKITNSLSDERIFCWKFFWKKRYMGKNKRKSNIFNRTRSQSSF